MCQRIECRRCGRPTYAGCGAHVEQVLGDVPPAERCRCREEDRREKDKRQHDKSTSPAGEVDTRSFLRRLLKK